MKRGTLIKIIASKPATGQDDISGLIGLVIPVVCVHRENGLETGEVSVNTSDKRKQIVLNRNEYEVVK